MIDKNKAMERARAYLAAIKMPPDTVLVLQENLTREEPFGWVFFYNTKKFVETGDYHHALLGNAPLIVDRRDGSLHETGTAKPIESYIEEYQRKRRKNAGASKKIIRTHSSHGGKERE